jgi:hypothetical protein
MEWITGVLGAVIGVLVAHLFHWRTLANLTRRVNLLEHAVEGLKQETEEHEGYGDQCADLSDEYLARLFDGPAIKTAIEPVVLAPAHTPLPVIRHLTVGGLLNLLPRRGVRIVPTMDGEGLKITATYRAMEEYKATHGSLEHDMAELVKNSGPVWELHVYNREELMQYEFRIANTKEPLDGL